MTVFRIERRKYLEHTLLGLGAKQSKGFRWNSFGVALVYAAESRALATLEIAVHLDIATDLPRDRIMVEVHIPNSVFIQRLSREELPVGWNAKPPTAATQWIGDEFAKRGEAAVLKVPSAVISQEYNYLINPLHSDAKLIRVDKHYPFQLDERL